MYFRFPFKKLFIKLFDIRTSNRRHDGTEAQVQAGVTRRRRRCLRRRTKRTAGTTIEGETRIDQSEEREVEQETTMIR